MQAMFGNTKKAPLLLSFSDCYIIHIERRGREATTTDNGEDKLCLNQGGEGRLSIAENLRSSREFSFLKYFLHRTGKIINIII